MEKLGFVERSIEQIAIVLKALLGTEIIEEQNDNFEMQLNDLLKEFFDTEAVEIEKINLEKLDLFIKKQGSNQIELLLLKTSKFYFKRNNRELSHKYFKLYQWVEQKQNRFFQFENNDIESLTNIYHSELKAIFDN